MPTIFSTTSSEEEPEQLTKVSVKKKTKKRAHMNAASLFLNSTESEEEDEDEENKEKETIHPDDNDIFYDSQENLENSILNDDCLSDSDEMLLTGSSDENKEQTKIKMKLNALFPAKVSSTKSGNHSSSSSYHSATEDLQKGFIDLTVDDRDRSLDHSSRQALFTPSPGVVKKKENKQTQEFIKEHISLELPFNMTTPVELFKKLAKDGKNRRQSTSKLTAKKCDAKKSDDDKITPKINKFLNLTTKKVDTPKNYGLNVYKIVLSDESDDFVLDRKAVTEMIESDKRAGKAKAAPKRAPRKSKSLAKNYIEIESSDHSDQHQSLSL